MKSKYTHLPRHASLRHAPKLALTAAAAALISVAASGPSPAAEAYSLAQNTPPAATADQIDQTTITAFAAAYVDVQKVAERWQPRIEGAQDQAAQQQLQSQANQEMAATVQSKGLDPQTYNQIFQLVRADPQFAAKVQQEINNIQ